MNRISKMNFKNKLLEIMKCFFSLSFVNSLKVNFLARLSYILGDHQEALSHQHRATLISERCCGIDHPNTIIEYTHLALYCFAVNQISAALRLLYRARYLMLIAHGENHPHMALLDVSLNEIRNNLI